MFANNIVGDGDTWFPTMSADSAFSNTVVAGIVSMATASAPAVAWNSTAGQFQIAVRGTNNRIYVGTAQASGAFNNDWLQLPTGSTSAAPAIAWDSVDSKVVIALKGSNGSNLFVANMNADGTGLSAWTQIAGSTLSAPAIAWNANTSRLQIAVRSSNNTIPFNVRVRAAGLLCRRYISCSGAYMEFCNGQGPAGCQGQTYSQQDLFG